SADPERLPAQGQGPLALSRRIDAGHAQVLERRVAPGLIPLMRVSQPQAGRGVEGAPDRGGHGGRVAVGPQADGSPPEEAQQARREGDVTAPAEGAPDLCDFPPDVDVTRAATMQAVAADAAIPALAYSYHGRNAGTQNPDLDDR